MGQGRSRQKLYMTHQTPPMMSQDLNQLCHVVSYRIMSQAKDEMQDATKRKGKSYKKETGSLTGKKKKTQSEQGVSIQLKENLCVVPVSQAS